ncbi:MAG: YkvA family protein [Akkermansiaceae bacterium]
MKFLKLKKPNFQTHRPEEFSVDEFWRVAKRLSRRGGRKLLNGGFTLYYCLRDADTPAWAKTVIAGALGYLILPMDFIPDAILGAGFTDDWSVILGAMAAVISHITDEHREKAAEMTTRFFGEQEVLASDKLSSVTES